ncbi:MAG: Asp-tRNA(Asn)/Glu-tRNA(Gln) amidotransferase GatCAB subunit B [Candidatus Omnitrophica bacterium CG07_land_8_20_14_0_80_42_15]|uniref:Aspartyl/glutamyl-tRNA(Asn/Gln) amidotransferase subunit B n=1 Tax=Candidatus Aquitaenariimonas noxiae TaxID=1974741 RepID=A0A2J0KXI8_9BACT|nr:MAG: Asp-tRNA(Asn)/Glu-tRNA(Gln) amidotransferase GatCAB subunit B [Candidatus Omnitrophica bacterium CG07_land_8_20_14_0_80_42_15]
MKYETVIGLEVHVQLATKSKIFCGCSTEFGAPPNSHTCPVCLGLPGALPVLNEEVMNLAIKVALALNCSVSKIMKFDRKNYYYPDLPKNFQISQYDMPLASDGYLEIETSGGLKKIGVKRAHLEEDAGKLIHDEAKRFSLVDLNRTGIPLLEVVSEPEISAPEEAYQYLINLKAILQYLDVSDCNMEEGSLRCDANVSIRPEGQKSLGNKVEIKNMNSFKGVKAALEYDIDRQISLAEKGERISQETRLWNSQKSVTISMRSKEEAHDYRYFPEPDLVPFEVEKKRIDGIKNTLPELPNAKRERFQSEYQLSVYDASVLVSDKNMADYFEEAIKIDPKNPKTIANWMINDISAAASATNLSFNEVRIKLKSRYLVNMIKMIDSGLISGKIAKDILKVAIETGKSPYEIAKEKNLVQISGEDEIRKVARDVMAGNKKSVADYREGKKQSFTFLVGQAMKVTKGKANPKLLNKILEEELQKGDA